MARKFVTGAAGKVVVTKIKRKREELPCQGCGTLVTVTTPYVGDILCPKCMKPTSYELHVE
jgi:hypothetical protein